VPSAAVSERSTAMDESETSGLQLFAERPVQVSHRVEDARRFRYTWTATRRPVPAAGRTYRTEAVDLLRRKAFQVNRARAAFTAYPFFGSRNIPHSALAIPHWFI